MHTPDHKGKSHPAQLARRLVTCHKSIRSQSLVIFAASPGIADLRNSNRILSQFASGPGPRRVQVVLNRDSPQSSFDEELIAKVLSQPVRWRVPIDFKSVREMQNTGVPIVMKDRPITQTNRSMACAALELSS